MGQHDRPSSTSLVRCDGYGKKHVKTVFCQKYRCDWSKKPQHKADRDSLENGIPTWERETTGARKGNTQLEFMNPGLPNHANGIERHNLDFKKEGEEKNH